MTELETASVVFFLLLASAGVGVFIRPLLPEEHKAFETVQLLKLVIGMLVTFAALVLGLLTASAKTLFDTTNNDIRSYATALIQLDNSLRQYGRRRRYPAPAPAHLHGGCDCIDVGAGTAAARRLFSETPRT